jgi:hypothetical protein
LRGSCLSAIRLTISKLSTKPRAPCISPHAQSRCRAARTSSVRFCDPKNEAASDHEQRRSYRAFAAEGLPTRYKVTWSREGLRSKSGPAFVVRDEETMKNMPLEISWRCVSGWSYPVAASLVRIQATSWPHVRWSGDFSKTAWVEDQGKPYRRGEQPAAIGSRIRFRVTACRKDTPISTTNQTLILRETTHLHKTTH